MSVESSFAAASLVLLAGHPDVEEGRIFHSHGLRTEGHFFAFVSRGDVVLKMPARRVGELVASGAGQPFDAGKGRPLREWVRVRPSTDAACLAHLREAYDFAAAPAETDQTGTIVVLTR